MTWDEYYEKFYDWADSTRANRLSALTDFGSSSEITEVAQELFEDTLVRRLIKKALEYGVRFTVEEVMELQIYLDAPTLSVLADTAVGTFDREQLEELSFEVDEEVFARISKKAGIDVLLDEDVCDDIPTIKPKPHKHGCFAVLFSLFAASRSHTNRPHKHNGKCDGNCANCPPHYGYRYGRWYYGHHHNYGCEFGGNKRI